MKLGLQTIPISFLVRRKWLDTEMRCKINESKVVQYAAEMADGANFPPPIVFVDHEELYRVGDGFHRVLAHQWNDKNEIEVMLKKGNRRDAFLYGIQANRKQLGLPFTQGDLGKCILTMMRDDETSKWPQTKIAEYIGCSQGYVSQVVKKFAIELPEVVIDRRGKAHSRPKVTKNEDDTNQRRKIALDMWLSGEQKKEIAAALDVGRSTVQNYIQDAMDDEHLVKCPHCNGTGVIKQSQLN